MISFLALLSLLAHGGGSLPIIALLVLVSARRGNGSFCLWGTQRLLSISLYLASVFPLWICLSYLAEVLPYKASLQQRLAPLLQAAGMPWSSSFIAGCAGLLLLFLAYNRIKLLPAADSYPTRKIIWPIGLILASAGCFFLVQVLINWPFAGFPPGLEHDRAIMAILRNAARSYFMGFCQAGAISLAVLLLLAKNLDRHHLFIAVRWLAFWAAAGALPHILVTWGASLGIAMRAPAAFAQSLIPQTLGLACLTLALGCWAFLLWRPQYFRILGILGLALLSLRTALPALLHLMQIG